MDNITIFKKLASGKCTCCEDLSDPLCARCMAGSALNFTSNILDGRLESIKRIYSDVEILYDGEKSSDLIKLKLCVIDLANGTFELWHAVADGKYDARSFVGDTVLNMQESLLEIGIDVRNKPLNIDVLKE